MANDYDEGQQQRVRGLEENEEEGWGTKGLT